MFWNCKYHGEVEHPQCHKCVREDGKMVEDELYDTMAQYDLEEKRKIEARLETADLMNDYLDGRD